MEDLKIIDCQQVFKFGPSKQYISKRMVDLPVIVRTLDGREDVLQVYTYLVDADIPFLCGKSELIKWKSKIDTENEVLETKIDGRRQNFRMVGTSGNHVALELEKTDLKEEQILFTTDDEDVNDYKAIKKVHEVNNHKSADQLIIYYRRANLIGPETTKLIKQVVKDCKVCQKFSKSLVKPKTALPIASSFNEIVTLDLKQFGDKYVLWCICAFTRFIQGRLLKNKKAETIINAIEECWNLPFGIPTIGYYADNGREFKNIKMDKLVSKLGISISYGPAYSPWSNGINERNHASCDIIIKKIMEDNKTGLTDAVIKTAALSHNQNVNKAGFSPLQLVTGKAANIPGLTMGNEGSESLTDAEAVNKIMETRYKITKEFREAETRKKLKDCQGIRVRNYQHQGKYITGDKIWFQHNDGNACYGPANVIYQKGNTIFAYYNGELRKIAMCKAKPYELIERTEGEKEENGTNEMAAPEMISKEVVQSNVPDENNEQGKPPEIIEEESEAENEDKIEDSETEREEEDESELRRDLQNDIIGAKYLQVEKSVYFMDYEIFSVEVPVKDHGKPEIVEAKNKEIENLKLYETFE